jgi:hypothetical protein
VSTSAADPHPVTPEPPPAAAPAPVAPIGSIPPHPGLKARRGMMDRIEAFISRKTSTSPLWHRVASLVWLPYAFRSGIRVKRTEDDSTFTAVLPFRKFNRNWYNAMAGASLLANSEIAGGMYLYGHCGGDYTVVCKQLTYKFLRPCFGPAIYRVTPKHDLAALIATGDEFNFDLELDIVQQLPTRGLGKEIRVGKCHCTFHVTPKVLHEARRERRARAKGERAESGQPAAGQDDPGCAVPPNP